MWSTSSPRRSRRAIPRANRRAGATTWRRCATLDDGLSGRVESVERLTPTIIDLVVRSPLAARKFEPGQFYRLQNFETESGIVAGTRLALEGIALTGAWVDKDRGLLSLIVLEMGASSRLCATLKPGQRVVVMGPTGSPTEIPHGEKVLLAGGGWATRSSSRSPRRCARPATGSSTSPATRTAPTCSSARRSSRPPIR